MPRKYIRKTDRQSWCVKNMAQGIKAVLDGKMGYKRASDTYNIPRSTLEYKVKKARESTLTPTEAAQKKLGRYTSVFPTAQENELVQCVLQLEQRLFSVTLTDIRDFAFELAESNNISHNFNEENKRAGKEWLYSFLQRHSKLQTKLSLRNRGKTSQSHKTVFSQADVDKFYNVLQSLYKKYQFSPNNIYSIDDIGIVATPEICKIANLRIKKRLNSNAQRIIVTAVICMSATRAFMPTMFVLPSGKSDGILMNGAPPGSCAVHHESGRIKKDTFILWFKRFLRFSAPSRDKPVLLLIDGLSPYAKSLKLFSLAEKNNVIILSFPPHSTHKLQPIELAFTPFLSENYKREVRMWANGHPKQSIFLIQEMVKSYKAAFFKTVTMKMITNGFEETGIFPFSRNVFGEITDIFADTIPANKQESYSNDEVQIPLSPHILSLQQKSNMKEEDNSQIDKSVNMDLSNCNEEFLEVSSVKKESKPVKVYSKRKSYHISNDTISVTEKIRKQDDHLQKDVFSFSENEEDIEQRLINNELYVYWIQCTQCQQWTHRTYSQVEKDDESICDTCVKNNTCRVSGPDPNQTRNPGSIPAKFRF